MKRYPRIRRVGHPDVDDVFDRGELVVCEKLDGNNFRFRCTAEDDLQFGSRTTKLGTDPDGIGGQFDAVTDYLAETVDREALAALVAEHGDLVFFGDNMVEHTLEYDWESVPQFLGFDVWLAAEERFASFERAAALFETVGLQTVPVVDRLPAEEFAAEYGTGDPSYEVPASQYHDGRAEGVVIRNETTHQRVKLVSEAFRERHKKPTDDEPECDEERLVERYCTAGRVRKTAHRLVDEGEWGELQMRMMEDLPMAVVEDVFAEEHTEILRTDWELDMPTLRNRVSKRCAGKLEEMVLR
ncbi:RNA ligase family protein [Haloarchaeobius sp. DT45]|uniref:RNA ligase family protein n=1 Tax=Haloarchaeobius sp. DT45 TaxID=3446116 RepID=UPI003F6BE4FE